MAWLSQFWRSLPRGTRLLLTLWIGGSLLAVLVKAATSLNLLSGLALDRSALAGFQAWRLITFALVGDDLLNAGLGAFFVAFLGAAVERVWNPAFFLAYYTGCAIASGLAILILAPGALPIFTPAGALLGLLVGWHAHNRSQRFQLFGGPEVSATASTLLTALCILIPAFMSGWRLALALLGGAATGWAVLAFHHALGGRRAARASQRPRMRRLEL